MGTNPRRGVRMTSSRALSAENKDNRRHSAIQRDFTRCFVSAGSPCNPFIHKGNEVWVRRRSAQMPWLRPRTINE
jgi:hypothetical protein